MVEERIIGNAPVLIVRPGRRSGPMATLLWYHGLYVDKSVHVPELEQFARAGIQAIGVDAIGHGARRTADLSARFSGPPAISHPLIFELVTENVDEVPLIVDELVSSGLADPARMGIGGVSFGGCIVYGAVPRDRRFRAAAALLATPEWPHPASPHLKPEAVAPTALLSVVAEKDGNVRPDAARRFHEALEPLYGGESGHSFLELPGEEHVMTKGGWAVAIETAVRWFRRHLKP